MYNESYAGLTGNPVSPVLVANPIFPLLFTCLPSDIIILILTEQLKLIVK